MITLENRTRCVAPSLSRARRRRIEVCIEGVRRSDGAVRLGIVVDEPDCPPEHYG